MADSTIRVAILGDVKGLSKALATGEKEVAGFGSTAKKVVGGIGFGLAAREVLDFGATALGEADRIGDAVGRLEIQIGEDLAGALSDTADDFAKLGQSRQDILELEAAFADMATALGVGAPFIAQYADDAAATAAAIELLGGADAATNIGLINKAAAGSEKALRTLGINLNDDAVAALAMQMAGKDTPQLLTDSEIAAAKYVLILEALKPKLDAVAEGSGDVERKQAEMQARWETLTGRIGEGLEGPMNDLLGWMLAGIDGWDKFIGGVEGAHGAVDALQDPVAALASAIAELVASFGGVLGLARQFGVIDTLTGAATGGGGGGSRPANHAPHPGVTLNVVPRDSQDTERAVIAALRDYSARSGRLE